MPTGDFEIVAIAVAGILLMIAFWMAIAKPR